MRKKKQNNFKAHVREKKRIKLKNKNQPERKLKESKPEIKQLTLENKRELDLTVVSKDDTEIIQEHNVDEFSSFFNGTKTPKSIITSNYKPSKRVYDFIRDMLGVIPNLHFYKRRKFKIKEIVQHAISRDFSSILIVHEDRKLINSLIHICLPNGPTAHYRLTNLELSKEIPNCGSSSLSKPEIILNNFNTRLGVRVGRMLSTLFPNDPDFKAREVCTFHNQRDFIFFRRHRYIIEDSFKDKERAELQELGPKFTLKLKSLQSGTFDTKYGSYE